jgi:RNA polymerase sigma-70 factor (ECF subfamily)
VLPVSFGGTAGLLLATHPLFRGRMCWKDKKMQRFAALFQPRRRTESPLERLERTLLRLDATTREIFLAHRLDAMSYTEIAERTGLSEKEVERRMAKAMRRITRAKPLN